LTTPDYSHDAFEPSSDAESARSTVADEGSNVCRAAALSSLFQQATTAMGQLTAEQRALGFSDRVIEGGGRNWRERDPLRGFDADSLTPDEDLDQTRVRRWIELNETADPRPAVGFLVAMLGSRLERESAAAAAALWRGLDLPTRQLPPPGPPRWRMYERLMFDLDRRDRGDRPWVLPFSWWGGQGPASSDGEERPWDPDLWHDTYRRLAFQLGPDRYVDAFLVTVLAQARLDEALRSPDAITRSLALAPFEFPADRDGSLPEPPKPPPTTAPGAPTISTIIHGTWAWKGSWWRPGGSFHQFIRGNYRSNLYNRGARFSWSGAKSEEHRALAAEDFKGWVSDVAPQGIQTLFGHSYGGEIAARASSGGTPIHELVLLSTPVTSHVEAVTQSGVRVIDVRLRFDPILAMTGKPQRINARPNVTQVLLRGWRLDHGATHEESVWRTEDVARRGRIQLEADLIDR
jgi:hypothetical protein